MTKYSFSRSCKTLASAALIAVATAGASYASGAAVSFLIPGGTGGGWDTTARTVGATLEKAGLASVDGYENFTGAGGGRALSSFVTEDGKYGDTLMVQSTPLIMRALTGVYTNDWRDTKPVAVMISAYQAIAVPADSPYQDLPQFVAALKSNPKGIVVAGGSGRLSLDHLTLGMLAKASGVDLDAVRYSASEGGGEALDSMLNSGHVAAIVSGVGELLEAEREGKIRILGVTSADPIPGLGIPTFKSQGVDVVFSNWRGFFAAPTVSDAEVEAYRSMLVDLSQTEEWAQARADNKWEPLVITGDALDAFLSEQEDVLGTLLKALQ